MREASERDLALIAELEQVGAATTEICTTSSLNLQIFNGWSRLLLGVVGGVVQEGCKPTA